MKFDGGPNGVGLHLGQFCGTGACEDGLVVCGDDELSLTCDSLDELGDESCNAVDDDCDGSTDENFKVNGDSGYLDPSDPGTPLFLGQVCGAGDCAGGIVVCEVGVATCSTAGEASDDVTCNGADDDCDGVVDDLFAAGGPIGYFDPSVGVKKFLAEPCGTGACVGGVVCDLALEIATCSGAANDVGDDEVLCDEVDDDCDGNTDEDFGLLVQCGSGACAGGVIECSANQTTSVCSTMPAGALQASDGSDNQATLEVCDDEDNDCDGDVDEVYKSGGDVKFDGGPFEDDADLHLGQVCGTGACAAGLVVCDTDDADLLTLTCDSLDEASDEACNGQDDNCDGEDDEGFGLGTQCGQGLGACEGGELECRDDTTDTRCSTLPAAIQGEDGSAVAASDELCDGIDNNCNGGTDEDFSTLGNTCGVGQCDTGSFECNDAQDGVRCDSMPADEQDGEAGSAPLSSAEVCDGVDNDCDGVDDEGFGLGQLCGQGDCAGGANECHPSDTGVVICSTLPAALQGVDGSSVQATGEICDGLDNNCDGATDEGCPCGKLGVACPDGFGCKDGNDPGEGWCVSDDAGSVWVPGGDFWMGCNVEEDDDCDDDEYTSYPDDPQHLVEVASFEIDRTEVTAAAYKACGTCEPADTGVYATYDSPSTQDHPINYVDWYQSQAYCEARGAGWRLCTEAEWEKAARGGCSLYCPEGDAACCQAAMPVYPWGDEAPTCDLTWFGACAFSTHPVGVLPGGASPYGAHDMAGNVWEWVEDWYHGDYSGAPSTGYPAWLEPSGSDRVVRGGTFFNSAAFVRAGHRPAGYSPGNASSALGLRCCRSAP